MIKLIRNLIQKTIVRYLRYCGGDFHCFPYGVRGRYIVLMDERQYGDYMKKAWQPTPTRVKKDT